MNCHFCSCEFSLFAWVMRPSVQKLGALQSRPGEPLQPSSAEPLTVPCTVLPARVSLQTPGTSVSLSQAPVGSVPLA